MRSRVLLVMLMSSTAALCSSCASYRTPGGPAPIADLAGQSAGVGTASTPSARFPARLALVRLQAPRYRSLSATGQGQGQYTLLPAQELLSSQQLDQVSVWPSVSTAVMVDTTLLTDRLDSMDELRMAAAKLQGDVLLSFTVDTVFQLQGKSYGPMVPIPLGTKPDEKARIVSTVSAAFIDVRTGFNYGALRASASAADLGKHWGNAATVDQQRLAVEQQAFDALLVQAQKSWALIAEQYD